MWNTALIFSNKRHGLQKRTLYRKKYCFFRRLGKNIVTRNWKIVWKQDGRLNSNLSVMLKFTERPKTPGWLQKSIAFPDRNKQFAGNFVLIWMKQTLIWFSLQRDGTRNGLPNIKETFAENLQLQMSVLHQSMSIFQGCFLKFIWWLGKM